MRRWSRLRSLVSRLAFRVLSWSYDDTQPFGLRLPGWERQTCVYFTGAAGACIRIDVLDFDPIERRRVHRVAHISPANFGSTLRTVESRIRSESLFAVIDRDDALVYLDSMSADRLARMLRIAMVATRERL